MAHRPPGKGGGLQDPTHLVPSQDHTVSSQNARCKHSADISPPPPHRGAGRLGAPASPGQGRLDCCYEVSILGTARPVASGERESVLNNPEVALAWSCFRRVCVLASELGQTRESRAYAQACAPAHVWVYVCACTEGDTLKRIPEKVTLILKEGSSNGRNLRQQVVPTWRPTHTMPGGSEQR